MKAQTDSTSKYPQMPHSQPSKQYSYSSFKI